MLVIRPNRARAFVAALMAFGLTGCGGFDGVELNGGIFDAMGIGSNSARTKEPVVPQRAGLVLPPRTDALPPPGTEVAVGNAAWPLDPEERKRQQNDVVKKQHAEYCAKAIQRKRAMGDDSPTQGPAGRCDPSVLGLFGLSGEVREMREPGR
ncbi:MAG: hypothetical protein ACOYLQ_17675 [Hyphomicrobiaceae bacterium]